jgi:hypothetical protein
MPSKFPNMVRWRNHYFVRQVTGHTGWRIDLIATVHGDGMNMRTGNGMIMGRGINDDHKEGMIVEMR